MQKPGHSDFCIPPSDVCLRSKARPVSWCFGGRFPIRVLICLAAVGAALCLVAGCVGAGRVVPASSFPQLEQAGTVELGSSAAAICQDGEALLALENSGTRVVRYGFRDSASALSILDTMPLTERVTAPAGIAADRFYIYIYDDHTLYRLSKEKLNLQAWLGDIRVAGLAGFEPGIMLVSDVDHGAIWYKGLFGESRLFISASEIARPGAMVALKDGTFAAVSTASKLLYFFNRSGVVTRSLSLPAACNLLAVNEQGLLCMGVRGEPQVWVLKAGRMTGHSLPDSVSPLSLAVVGTSLAVLDAGTRISVYRLPEAE
jgi:hypothetical protein